MADINASFGGSIPDIYDRHLGPMFFEPYAQDLARRLKVPPRASVLEIAAGTGIVTRHLLAALPPDAHLVVTDVNDAMLALARRNVGADARADYQTADATALPFPDRHFDAVVCQFGLMFFPDKVAALREMRRVLKPAGTVLLNVWGSLQDNPIAGVAHEAMATFFHGDAPQFYTIPFGLHDRDQVTRLFQEAGFTSVEAETVDLVGESPSAIDAATGLVFGTPVINSIQERGTVSPEVIMHAVAAGLTSEGGATPMRLPMRALVFRASLVP